jgi:prepilin-type N-terminal cleavage/methylation domain-containing protein
MWQQRHRLARSRLKPAVHGFTLMEIMVVMSILAVLLGLTAGALQRAGKSGVLDGAARVVRSALERARVLALQKSALSKITIVPGKQGAPFTPPQIRMQVSRVAGSWHFDDADPSVGGDGATVTLLGAGPAEGWVRSGMQLTPISRIRTAPVSRAPTMDPRFGFSLEMMVRPDGPGTLAAFAGESGDSSGFALRLNADGSLAAEATVRAEKGSLSVQTRPNVIEMGEWVKVAIAHDGVELTVSAHNVIEARAPDLHEVVTEPGDALVLGNGFSGVIDEVVYRTVSDLEPVNVDQQVEIGLNYPTSIRFNQEGRLNERFHSAPVAIPLTHERRTVTITVDMAGVIR